MTDHTQNTELLDSAIAAIKSDVPAAADMADATARVRAQIAARRGQQAGAELPPQVAATNWNSIEDYIAAIPDYLAEQLNPAQKTLFEEESRQSIPLRRALNEARGRDAAQALGTDRSSNASRYRWLAVAATVAAVAISLILVMPQLPSRDQTRLAQIDAVDGQLYQLIDGRLESLTPGTWIDGRQRIRSGQESKAMVVLDDGSRIEMDERSELSVTRRGTGNRIDVSRGRILVEASPQASGTLDVFTNEFEVSVTGTIFEVAHGAKGSRVAVIEGSVNVSLQGNTTILAPGDMMGSRTDYLARNIIDEIAWSENADQYLAMLQEVAALQQDLQQVLAVAPRYSTRLLDLAPAQTAVYVAVPNAPEKVAEVYEVIRSRMQSSQFLSTAWAEFEQGAEAESLDEVMTWMREIGYALGDETVFALSMDDSDDSSEAVTTLPVVLSEVDAANFAATFNDQIQRVRDALAAEGHDSELEINLIYHPREAVDGDLSILLYEDLLVAATDVGLLEQMYADLQVGSSAFAGSKLHALLQSNYAQGTEILGAVYIPGILDPTDITSPDFGETGLQNAEYLIAQYQRGTDAAVITADLFFSGERTGVMSWLATPGPMGSLEFFSTNTKVVAALLLREPLAILEELDTIGVSAEFNNEAELDLFYSVMATLGGEFAIGLDGPALPTPAWKAVIEAYDAALLQENIEATVTRLNAQAATEGVAITIALSPSNVEGYSGFQVSLTADPAQVNNALNISTITFQYAFVDGYLVAAPDAALVGRAIEFYESGSGLQTDAEYRELMLRDGYLDFSAVYFSRLGQLLNSLMQKLPANVTAEQQAAIAALDIDVGPSMTSVLALPDKMHVAHTGSGELPLQLLSNFAVIQPLLETLQAQGVTVN